MAVTRPVPWAGLAAVMAGLAWLTWVPSGGLGGFVGLVGLGCVAAGWRSARRRWLLWLALVANAFALINTLLVVASEVGG